MIGTSNSGITAVPTHEVELRLSSSLFSSSFKGSTSSEHLLHSAASVLGWCIARPTRDCSPTCCRTKKNIRNTCSHSSTTPVLHLLPSPLTHPPLLLLPPMLSSPSPAHSRSQTMHSGDTPYLWTNGVIISKVSRAWRMKLEISCVTGRFCMQKHSSSIFTSLIIATV